MTTKVFWTQLCVCCGCSVTAVVSDSLWPRGLQPAKLPCPWNFPGKNTGVGCHFFFLKRGSFQPRDRTHISCLSCTEGRFFCHWATTQRQIRLTNAERKLRKQCVQLPILSPFKKFSKSDKLLPFGLPELRIVCLQIANTSPGATAFTLLVWGKIKQTTSLWDWNEWVPWAKLEEWRWKWSNRQCCYFVLMNSDRLERRSGGK